MCLYNSDTGKGNVIFQRKSTKKSDGYIIGMLFSAKKYMKKMMVKLF